MQCVILDSQSVASSSPPAPSPEDLAAVLHAGSVRVWFGIPVTRQLTAVDFNSDGEPTTAVIAEFSLQELSLVCGPCSVEYGQEQVKRKSQGRTFHSQVDVTGETFKLKVPLTSIHKTAGDEIRRLLSGGFVTGGVYGQNLSGKFEPFSFWAVGENFYEETGSADYLVGVIFAGSSPGFSFSEDDEAFAVIEAEIEAGYGTNEAIGVSQTFSI